jgi:heme/copper-type cytochrome/quinol oxidase subunit 2
MPCRACGHRVDTSALACPGCGATDPAKKISRQQRDFYLFIVSTVIWIGVLGGLALCVWKIAIPWARQTINKQAAVELPPLRESPRNGDE